MLVQSHSFIPSHLLLLPLHANVELDTETCIATVLNSYSTININYSISIIITIIIIMISAVVVIKY